MQLSNEDTLRLNVLLAHSIQAIRIDESSMTVHALSERGETKVTLSPNCREDQYLRRVREFLSSHFLGSPGGYPVYLKRWTRMGQARSTESLERLLLLGEPEAVVAVVHAPSLTHELARRAWWSMPTSENARRLLVHETVRQGPLGAELAEYLVEHLPFEEEPQGQIETVRLALQPGLIDPEMRQRLWNRGRQKNSYLIGFLDVMPDELPEPHSPHPEWERVDQRLQTLVAAGNPYAVQMSRTLSCQGQAFLSTVELVLRRPANQDVVVALFDTIGHYFAAARAGDPPGTDIQTLIQAADRLCDEQTSAAEVPEALRQVLQVIPEQRRLVAAMVALAWLGEPILVPLFARTTAIGSLMRRKLEPITGPLAGLVKQLKGLG